MSLKKDNNPNCVKRSSFGTYSIVTRLTIAYTFTVFGILTLTTCVLYYALTTTLHNKDKRFLIDKIIHFRSIIKSSQYDVYELKGWVVINHYD